MSFSVASVDAGAAVRPVVRVVKVVQDLEVVEAGFIFPIPDGRPTMDGSLGMYLSILMTGDVLHRSDADEIGLRICSVALKLTPMVNSLGITATINRVVCFMGLLIFINQTNTY